MDASPRAAFAGATQTSTGQSEHKVRWSAWFRCESSFSLLLVPGQPGVYVVGEEVIAPGEVASLGARRMLAVLEVGATDDLARALSRLFTAASAVRDRLLNARCFMRFAQVSDPAQRQAVCAALQNWLAGAAHAAGEARREGVASPSPLPAGF
jgi:hypothetical protein